MSRSRRQRVTPKKARRLKLLFKTQTNFKGQLLNRQFQLAVYKVQKYFRREKLNGGPLLPVQQVGKRVSQALGIGINYVTRVKKIGDKGDPFLTPGKSRKMKRKKRDIDDFTKCAIRNLIYEFHRKRLPMSVAILLKKIKERGIYFHGGQETLRKVLHDLGFRYKKKNGTRFLMEQPRIVLLRLAFIRRFRKLYLEGKKNFVYLDETWVFQKGSGLSFAWQNDDIRTSVRHVSSGGRYVVIHAGGREGFIQGAGKVWSTKAKPKPGDDYHDNMNGALFKNWFTQDFLPNLRKPSVIVMDNASYHSCEEEDEKLPNTNSRNDEIQAWLLRHKIPFEHDMLKRELLALVRLNKKPKSYIIDGLMAGTQHEILRLPPYHACFNPIELVWGLVKRYFDTHVGRNQDYSTDMMMTIFEEALETITPEVWARICNKVEKKILDAYDAEIGANEVSNNGFQMVINVGEDDSDDEDEWETVEQKEIFGTDPDEPSEMVVDSPVNKHSRKKLAKEEMACGISFKEVLFKGEMQRLEGTKCAIIGKKVKRSLFASGIGSNVENDLKPLGWCTPSLPLASDPDLGRIPSEDLRSPTTVMSPPSFSFSCPENPDMGMDYEEIVPSVDLTITPAEGHCHYPVLESFSIAWSLIPERYISGEEIESAVNSVTSLSKNHAVENHCEESLHAVSHHLNSSFYKSEVLEELPRNSEDECPLKSTSSAMNRKTVSKKVAKIVVTPSDAGYMLLHDPFSTTIVDSYFKLIQDFSCNKGTNTMVFPSHFFKEVIVLKRNLTNFSFSHDALCQYDLVFIPVHLSLVWCLIVIFPKKKAIRYYTTLEEDNEECLDAFVHVLNDLHLKEKRTSIDWGRWTVECNTFPANQSIEDSPLLICCFGRCILEGLPCLFGLDNLQDVRHQMSEEIKSGKLAPLKLPAPPSESGTQPRTWYRGNLLDDNSKGISLEEAMDVFGLETVDRQVDHTEPVMIKSIKEGDIIPKCDAVDQNENIISSEIIELSDDDDIAAPVLKGDGSLDMTLQEILALPEETVLLRQFNHTVKVADLLTLRDTYWLNDTIINYYLTMLREQIYFKHGIKVFNMSTHFFSQLSVSYEKVSTWSKKVELFDLKLLLIPINIQNAHWALCVVNIDAKTISYLDSMGNSNATALTAILLYLEAEHNWRSNAPFLRCAWKLENVTDIAQQNNGYDCGVFVCWYARKLCAGEPIPSKVSSLQWMRLKMMREIATGCLLPDISNSVIITMK